MPTPAPTTAGVDLLGGHQRLDEVDQRVGLSEASGIRQWLLELPYDLVIVDTPPALGLRHLGDCHRLPEPERVPGQPDVVVELEWRSEGSQDSKIERHRRLGRLVGAIPRAAQEWGWFPAAPVPSRAVVDRRCRLRSAATRPLGYHGATMGSGDGGFGCTRCNTLRADELDDSFVENLRSLFKDREFEIVVSPLRP